jgi:hypothetical protein
MQESNFARLVRQELEWVRRVHRPMGSLHEAYAVILEELEEFWEEVRKKAKDRSNADMLFELVQVAAMCQKTAEDLLAEALPGVVG